MSTTWSFMDEDTEQNRSPALASPSSASSHSYRLSLSPVASRRTTSIESPPFLISDDEDEQEDQVEQQPQQALHSLQSYASSNLSPASPTTSPLGAIRIDTQPISLNEYLHQTLPPVSAPSIQESSLPPRPSISHPNNLGYRRRPYAFGESFMPSSFTSTASSSFAPDRWNIFAGLGNRRPNDARRTSSSSSSTVPQTDVEAINGRTSPTFVGTQQEQAQRRAPANSLSNDTHTKPSSSTIKRSFHEVTHPSSPNQPEIIAFPSHQSIDSEDEFREVEDEQDRGVGSSSSPESNRQSIPYLSSRRRHRNSSARKRQRASTEHMPANDAASSQMDFDVDIDLDLDLALALDADLDAASQADIPAINANVNVNVNANVSPPPSSTPQSPWFEASVSASSSSFSSLSQSPSEPGEAQISRNFAPAQAYLSRRETPSPRQQESTGSSVDSVARRFDGDEENDEDFASSVFNSPPFRSADSSMRTSLSRWRTATSSGIDAEDSTTDGPADIHQQPLRGSSGDGNDLGWSSSVSARPSSDRQLPSVRSRSDANSHRQPEVDSDGPPISSRASTSFHEPTGSSIFAPEGGQSTTSPTSWSTATDELSRRLARLNAEIRLTTTTLGRWHHLMRRAGGTQPAQEFDLSERPPSQPSAIHAGEAVEHLSSARDLLEQSRHRLALAAEALNNNNSRDRQPAPTSRGDANDRSDRNRAGRRPLFRFGEILDEALNGFDTDPSDTEETRQEVNFRPGALGASGRFVGPTRLANQDWLGLSNHSAGASSDYAQDRRGAARARRDTGQGARSLERPPGQDTSSVLPSPHQQLLLPRLRAATPLPLPFPGGEEAQHPSSHPNTSETDDSRSSGHVLPNQTTTTPFRPMPFHPIALALPSRTRHTSVEEALSNSSVGNVAPRSPFRDLSFGPSSSSRRFFSTLADRERQNTAEEHTLSEPEADLLQPSPFAAETFSARRERTSSRSGRDSLVVDNTGEEVDDDDESVNVTDRFLHTLRGQSTQGSVHGQGSSESRSADGSQRRHDPLRTYGSLSSRHRLWHYDRDQSGGTNSFSARTNHSVDSSSSRAPASHTISSHRRLVPLDERRSEFSRLHANWARSRLSRRAPRLNDSQEDTSSTTDNLTIPSRDSDLAASSLFRHPIAHRDPLNWPSLGRGLRGAEEDESQSTYSTFGNRQGFRSFFDSPTSGEDTVFQGLRSRMNAAEGRRLGVPSPTLYTDLLSLIDRESSFSANRGLSEGHLSQLRVFTYGQWTQEKAGINAKESGAVNINETHVDGKGKGKARALDFEDSPEAAVGEQGSTSRYCSPQTSYCSSPSTSKLGLSDVDTPLSTSAPSDSEGPENCSICLDEYMQESSLAETWCKHVFHEHCLKQWFKQASNCPMCRRSPAAASMPNTGDPRPTELLAQSEIDF
ncbi:unnamed protein product [Sympodiomycopsis kandeliae]